LDREGGLKMEDARKEEILKKLAEAVVEFEEDGR
jgi:hypothetical protein